MKILNKVPLCHAVTYLVLATFSVFGEEAYVTTNNIAVPDSTAVDAVKDVRLKRNLRKSLDVLRIAQKDLNEIRSGVEAGTISIQNNHGLWCAVLRDETTLRTAIFATQDKLSYITHLKKRVWTDLNHEREIHGLGYEIFFGTNGVIETYMTRDGKEILKYYSSGQLKRFSVAIGDGQYSAEWNNSGVYEAESKREGKPVLGDTFPQSTNEFQQSFGIENPRDNGPD